MAPHRKKQRLSEDGKAISTVPSEGTVTAEQNHENAEQNSQMKPTRSLFVRSLAAATTNDDLTEHFSQSYPIRHAIAVLDPSTKQCKGYGFVTFADTEDAQRARGEFDGSTLQGRQIKVEFAESRHRGEEAGEKSIKKPSKSFQEQSMQPPPKLIVRNLPWSIKGPDQLTALFRSYGKIKHAVVPKRRDGTMAGFGIVLIRGQKNAEKAISGLNGKELDGRTLAVDWAVDKETWEKVKATEISEAKAVNGVDVHENGDLADQMLEGQDSQADNEQSGAPVLMADVATDSSNMSDSFHEEVDSDGEDSGDDDDEDQPKRTSEEEMSYTLFVRNLPFTCSDQDLYEHFEQFGPIRYARVVLDRETERPRGTGFVAFVKPSDADICVKEAPIHQAPKAAAGAKTDKASSIGHSILQNVDADPTGRYTLEGRVLQISRAVQKEEATRLTEEGVARRFARDKDKRRLYLLSEGTISTNSPLYKSLSPSEIAMRESSLKQRKSIIENNPSLHFSLIRLSIRNIPRSMTSKDLKALAREAVVGFAKDVAGGKRQPLSKEEKVRGGEEMKEAEKHRKEKAKGIVKQAKIVFEGQEGGKVPEDSGAGRSRGYGFIEYHTHRSALMGLRWLNGHAIKYTAKDAQGKPVSREELQDRKKRLIVEFAIENAQVVARRKDKEVKARFRSKADQVQPKAASKANGHTNGMNNLDTTEDATKQPSRKRKRGADDGSTSAGKIGGATDSARNGASKDEKSAKREKIIQRKRMMRRARKKGRAA